MLNTEDVEKLADFYGELLQKKPEMEDREHGMVGYLAGNTFISICLHDKVKGKNENPERFIIFFETSEVDAEFERISKIDGASVVKEPYSPDPEGKFKLATLADPDGNYFQLATPWNA